MSEEALRRLRELKREHAALVRALDRELRDRGVWKKATVSMLLLAELKTRTEAEIDVVTAEIWRGDGI